MRMGIMLGVVAAVTFVGSPASADSTTSFGSVRQVQVEAGARALAVSPDGATAYVVAPGRTTRTPGTLQAIDVVSGQVSGSVAIVPNPSTPVVSKNGSRVFVPSIEAGGVSVIDARTLTVTKTVTFEKQTASGGNSVLSSDGRFLYVPSNRNSVNMIDTKTLKVIAKAPVTIKFGSCGPMIGLAISQNNAWMYATCGQGVFAFDPRIGNPMVLDQPKAPGANAELYSGRAWPLLAPDGQTVVTFGDRSIEMFRAKTLQQTGQVEFADPSDLSALAAGVVLPSRVVVSPSASTGELLFVDLTGNQVLPPLKVSDPLAWAPPLLAMRSQPIVAAPSGATVYVTRPGAKPSIDTVNVTSGTRVARDLIDPQGMLAAPVDLGSPVLADARLVVLATSPTASSLVILDPR